MTTRRDLIGMGTTVVGILMGVIGMRLGRHLSRVVVVVVVATRGSLGPLHR